MIAELGDSIKDIPSLLPRIQKYFKENFALPRYKYESVDLDIAKVLEVEDTAEIEAWVFNNGDMPDYYGTPMRKIRTSPYLYNFLRIVNKPKQTRIESILGEAFLSTTAKQVYDYAAAFWNGENGSRRSKYIGRNELYVYEDYISYGCQSVPRSEVERIAKQMGWS